MVPGATAAHVRDADDPSSDPSSLADLTPDFAALTRAPTRLIAS